MYASESEVIDAYAHALCEGTILLDFGAAKVPQGSKIRSLGLCASDGQRPDERRWARPRTTLSHHAAVGCLVPREAKLVVVDPVSALMRNHTPHTLDYTRAWSVISTVQCRG